jgi:hypothetical protein
MSTDNDKTDQLYEEADQVIRLCETLDFQGIVRHRPQAVAALQNVIRVLKLELPRLREGGTVERGESQSVRPAPSSEDDKAAAQLRRRQMVEALTHAGLGDRLGKIYNTRVERRIQPFREAPHKMGLPMFDMVIAPDFSPEDGLHAIVVAPQEILSCLLPGADSTRPWQVRQRVRYSSGEELVDLVSLMSAGFPVG